MRKIIIVLLLFCCVAVIAGGPGRDSRKRREGYHSRDSRMSGLVLAAGIVDLTASTLNVLNPRPVIVSTPAYIQPLTSIICYPATSYSQPVVIQQPVYVQQTPLYVAPSMPYVPRVIRPMPGRRQHCRPYWR